MTLSKATGPSAEQVADAQREAHAARITDAAKRIWAASVILGTVREVIEDAARHPGTEADDGQPLREAMGDLEYNCRKLDNVASALAARLELADAPNPAIDDAQVRKTVWAAVRAVAAPLT